MYTMLKDRTSKGFRRSVDIGFHVAEFSVQKSPYSKQDCKLVKYFTNGFRCAFCGGPSGIDGRVLVVFSNAILGYALPTAHVPSHKMDLQ